MVLGGLYSAKLNRNAAIWSALCVLHTGTYAFANPTSLNVIPTAEVLRHGNATFSAQLSGGPTSSGYTFENELQTELGIGDNIEFGFDASLGPGGPNLWNAKYHLLDESRRRPALAVGVLSNAGQFDSPVYVTAFKTDGEAPISLQADYISGPETFASIGVVVNWPSGASLNVAQLIGNSSSAANAYLVIVSWTGKIF